MLTAANCIHAKGGDNYVLRSEDMYVLFSEFDEQNSNYLNRKVSEFSLHPDWDTELESKWDADIAIIRLSNEVPFDLFTPICLNRNTNEEYYGKLGSFVSLDLKKWSLNIKQSIIKWETKIIDSDTCFNENPYFQEFNVLDFNSSVCVENLAGNGPPRTGNTFDNSLKFLINLKKH